MKPKILLILLLCIVITNVFAYEPKFKKDSPESAVEDLIKLFKKLDYSDTADTGLRNEVIKEINSVIDYSIIAKESLIIHWQDITDKDKKKFIDLLEKVVTKVGYTKVSDYYGSIEIEYLDVEELDKKSFIVKTNVYEEDAEVEIHYKMIKNEKGTWSAVDFIIDDISLINNYKSQFNMIIKDKSFQHLIELLEKKL